MPGPDQNVWSPRIPARKQTRQLAAHSGLPRPYGNVCFEDAGRTLRSGRNGRYPAVGTPGRKGRNPPTPAVCCRFIEGPESTHTCRYIGLWYFPRADIYEHRMPRRRIPQSQIDQLIEGVSCQTLAKSRLSRKLGVTVLAIAAMVSIEAMSHDPAPDTRDRKSKVINQVRTSPVPVEILGAAIWAAIGIVFLSLYGLVYW
jgi:hypothetical protein